MRVLCARAWLPGRTQRSPLNCNDRLPVARSVAAEAPCNFESEEDASKLVTVGVTGRDAPGRTRVLVRSASLLPGHLTQNPGPSDTAEPLA